MKLSQAVTTLQKFYGTDLTHTLVELEASIRGASADTFVKIAAAGGVGSGVLAAAGLLKHIAGQINVAIHALGILLCLPHLLEDDETIEYVSLGAGNTGRAFDLETNKRIAEFKFIRWQGGPESIRQNALFKDFYLMAEYQSQKRKFLHVLETNHPLKFFNGGRALSSVLSRNDKVQNDFRARYGDKYRTVRDYYAFRKVSVTIQDVSPWVPGLAKVTLDVEQTEV